MHRATFAQKEGAVALQDEICLQQDAPEAVGVGWIVGSVQLIFIASNGVRYFTWQWVDRDLDPQRVQAGHEFPVKGRDRTWDERQGFDRASAGLDEEAVVDEVKHHLKALAPIGNGSGRQPT